MCAFCAADDVLPRSQHRLQGRDVGAGAVEDEEHLDLLAEQRRETARRPRRCRVVTVRHDMPDVDLGQLGEDVGVDAGVVVAGEAATADDGFDLRSRGGSAVRSSSRLLLRTSTPGRRRSARPARRHPSPCRGLASRMAGVRMAGTTTTLAVADVPLKPSARASTMASAPPCWRVGGVLEVGAWACLAETMANRPCGGRRERVGEGAGHVHGGADEKVVQPAPSPPVAPPARGYPRASRRPGARRRRPADAVTSRRRTNHRLGVEQVDDVRCSTTAGAWVGGESRRAGPERGRRARGAPRHRAAAATTVGPRPPAAPVTRTRCPASGVLTRPPRQRSTGASLAPAVTGRTCSTGTRRD